MRWNRIIACACAVVLMTGSSCCAAGARDDVDTAQRVASGGFYVDPNSSAARAMVDYPETASIVARLADTPQAFWLSATSPPTAVANEVGRYVDAAARANAVPVLVTYAIPQRDCGSYSAGGYSNGADYRTWSDNVAAGIGNREAVVIVEPDALTDWSCLSSEQATERVDLLRYSVNALASDPNTAVYIDGGHSRWLDAPELASRLESAGVDRARGFSLNVANFYTTAEQEAYGESVSALTDGKTYVVDTSRNGAGPPPEGPLNWCNPPDRALGSAPTTQTRAAHAAAYLWVKHPGESDGTCNRGEPPSSVWWNAYAVAIVQNSGRRRGSQMARCEIALA